MQKVEGSNPFSRFFENALHVGGSGSAQVAETKWNHPRIGDYGRLRLAFGWRRSYGRSLRLPSSHNPAAWRYGSTWHPR